METRVPLRAQLQSGTRAAHDRLDGSVARLDGSVARLDLLRPANYARFLASQLHAREGIEEWADRHCPGLLRPPPVTSLLREDFDELAAHLGPDAPAVRGSPRPLVPFTLPAGADPVGLAWAIAGSQLGNRAILVRLRKGAAKAGEPGPDLPSRFLADQRMTAFWHRLLPRLQEPVGPEQAEPALVAARAVFARFEQAFTSDEVRCRQAA